MFLSLNFFKYLTLVWSQKNIFNEVLLILILGRGQMAGDSLFKLFFLSSLEENMVMKVLLAVEVAG